MARSLDSRLSTLERSDTPKAADLADARAQARSLSPGELAAAYAALTVPPLAVPRVDLSGLTLADLARRYRSLAA